MGIVGLIRASHGSTDESKGLALRSVGSKGSSSGGNGSGSDADLEDRNGRGLQLIQKLEVMKPMELSEWSQSLVETLFKERGEAA